MKEDDIARLNRQFWKANVERGDMYSTPWLDLEAEVVRKWVAGEIEHLPEPFPFVYPSYIFKDVAAKDILCLASGGGQQSVVFGLIRANVTVSDLTEEQLDGDR